MIGFVRAKAQRREEDAIDDSFLHSLRAFAPSRESIFPSDLS